MRVLTVLLLVLTLCVHCCGKKMWGARSKRDTDGPPTKKNSDKPTKHPTKSKDSIKTPSSLFETTPSTENGGDFGDVDNLFNKMDDALDQITIFLQSGKLQETLQSEAAQEWLNTLRSVEDPNISQILEGMNFEDHDQLTEQLLASIQQLQSQKSELRELFNNPSFFSSLLNEIPHEYQSLVQSILNGNIDKLKDELFSMPGVDSELKTLLENILEGNFDFTKGTLSNLFTDEQIETTRQELISNPELLEMMQIPVEVLKNPLLFSQYMKNSMDSLSDETTHKKAPKSRKVRAL